MCRRRAAAGSFAAAASPCFWPLNCRTKRMTCPSDDVDDGAAVVAAACGVPH